MNEPPILCGRTQPHPRHKWVWNRQSVICVGVAKPVNPFTLQFEVAERLAKLISEYTEDYQEMVMPLAEYILDELDSSDLRKALAAREEFEKRFEQEMTR